MAKEVLRIYAHSRDCNTVEYTVDGKKLIDKHSIYLPYCEGLCGGDDMHLEIDVETGQILNWNAEKVRMGLAPLVEEEEE